MPSICTLHPHTSKLTARVCLLKQRAVKVRRKEDRSPAPAASQWVQRRWIPPRKVFLRGVTILVFFDAVKRAR